MATTQTKTTAVTSVPDLLDELGEIAARIKGDEERWNEIIDQLADLEPGTYRGNRDDHVRVSSYTRLNTKKAMEALSPRSQARVMVLKPDAQLIRKYFPGVARRSTDVFENRVNVEVSSSVESRLRAV